MTSTKSAATRSLQVGVRNYQYVSLETAAADQSNRLSCLPFSLRTLLENLLRHCGAGVAQADVDAVLRWESKDVPSGSVPFHPARVLMQDFTGVPCIADLAAMRDAVAAQGGDDQRINPVIPVDFIVDHSLTIDHAGSPGAMAANMALEYRRNAERYAFMRWAQAAFRNLRVAVPGAGILHQVNLEHIAQVVWTAENDGTMLAYPDTLVGTDSHTTMINALGVLGWGVGGIEAEAAMLGQPLMVTLPKVVGIRLTGAAREGVGATDIVLSLTDLLRQHGVVEKFVEFTGEALDGLPVADRATIANMAPEYGSTCAFFPVDRATLDYLALTGRDPDRVALVEAYARAQLLWRDSAAPEPLFSEMLEFDLGAVAPCAAGPRRPQQRTSLSALPAGFRSEMKCDAKWTGPRPDEALGDGAVVIAAITSCTNTSNPAAMIAAGLLARKAVACGLRVKPWVKTSLTPGSRVVSAYLEASGLQRDLEVLRFHLTGYGCGTCAGSSGPLDAAIASEVASRDLVACAVLSGNRNFEGRIHPQVRAGYLMSLALVVAYALAGRITLDMTAEPIGIGSGGQPVMLADLWPRDAEIAAVLRQVVTPEMFRARYAGVFGTDDAWERVPTTAGSQFGWSDASTYIQRPPFFDTIMPGSSRSDIINARPLLVLGDAITTDHISPVGAIVADSPAGRYLLEQGVSRADFNAYGSRRSNHHVMVRGAFANPRLQNEMVPGREGGFTRHMSDGAQMPIYDAAMRYGQEGVPLVIIAGRDYGAGSSRDWAAKGTRLLGVRAVIAESFERIHRSNLVSMGVLPLTFPNGVNRRMLALDGTELITILFPPVGPQARSTVVALFKRTDGAELSTTLHCRLDNDNDRQVWMAGGILPYLLQEMTSQMFAEGRAEASDTVSG